MAGIFDSFIGGVQAGQQQQFNQNRLATLNEQNSPDNVARRNKLADIQVQDAQSSLDQNKAKEGYTRLSQAMNSPNPKAYVLQFEPDLAANLQKSAGVDLSSMDDNQAKGVLGALASHLAGAAGIAPVKQYQTIGDTANPGAGILQKDPQTDELKQVVAPQKPDAGSSDIQGYNFAKGQGFKGSFLDYQKQSADSKRAGQNENTQLIQTVDPDTKETVWKLVDKNTGQTLNPNVGSVAPSAAGGGGSGGREATMFNRVLMNASQVTKSAENIMKIPADADRGWFGSAAPGTSILGSVKSALANKVSDQSTQRYNVLVAGITRSLAGIESAGLAPSGTLTHQMDAVIAQPGDTGITRLSKLAEVRQIMQEGLSTYLSNPRVAPEQKAQVQTLLDRMDKAIPFTQDDVTALDQAQNPKTTINDVVKKRLNVGSSGGPAQPQGNKAPAQAEAYLMQHPELKGAFQAKYGYVPNGI